MRAVDRTTQLFVASVKATAPGVSVQVSRSINSFGRSNYVYIGIGDWGSTKVRISDHPVGMYRALSGREDLYIAAGARPAHWAIWLAQFMRKHGEEIGQKRRNTADARTISQSERISPQFWPALAV